MQKVQTFSLVNLIFKITDYFNQSYLVLFHQSLTVHFPIKLNQHKIIVKNLSILIIYS